MQDSGGGVMKGEHMSHGDERSEKLLGKKPNFSMCYCTLQLKNKLEVYFGNLN